MYIYILCIESETDARLKRDREAQSSDAATQNEPNNSAGSNSTLN